MVKNLVNTNAKQAFPAVPGFLDFVFHPAPICRFSTNKDNGACSILKLCVDPALDANVASAFDFLPFVVTGRWVSFDNSDVANFGSTPSITLLVKAVKDFARHGRFLFPILVDGDGVVSDRALKCEWNKREKSTSHSSDSSDMPTLFASASAAPPGAAIGKTFACG